MRAKLYIITAVDCRKQDNKVVEQYVFITEEHAQKQFERIKKFVVQHIRNSLKNILFHKGKNHERYNQKIF